MKTIRDLLTGNLLKISKDDLDAVIWPARVEPPHKMHLEYILGLSRIFKKVIIIIGSANTYGDSRHCILATVRAKMVEAMLNEAGLNKDKYKIIPLNDYNEDVIWSNKIIQIANMYYAKYIASGNEWISKIFSNTKLGIKVFDPDLGITDTFRATDVRNAIIKGNLTQLKKMLSPSVLQMLLTNDCYQGVILSDQNKAAHFVDGRQTVDIAIIIKDSESGRMYVLLGKRKQNKKDFPGVMALPGGPINDFEFPNEAAIRILKEETGLELLIQDTMFLDDPVRFADIDTILLTMKLVGIYSSIDPDVAGSQGGSSQCFTVFVEDDISKFKNVIESKKNEELKDLECLDFYEITDELIRQKLAFQHNEMLNKAIHMAKSKIKIENDQ